MAVRKTGWLKALRREMMAPAKLCDAGVPELLQDPLSRTKPAAGCPDQWAEPSAPEVAAALGMDIDSLLVPSQTVRTMPDSIPAVEALEEVLSSPLGRSSLGCRDMEPDFEFGVPGSFEGMPVPGAELLDVPPDAIP